MTFTVSKTVSDETLDCIIQIESAGRPNAKAPTSSATGFFQFLNQTWLNTVRVHRPDVFAKTGAPQLLAMRTDPTFCIEMGARFTEDNQRIIGMSCTGGDLYLAHFLGAGAAKAVFRAQPNTPVMEVVGPGPVQANKSILSGKSCGQVRAWAARRMAESGGHGWIKKYYRPAKAAALVDEPATPAAEPEPDTQTADDIPDPQDAPATPPPLQEPTAVVPVDASPEEVDRQIAHSAARDAEPAPSWLKRKWKSVTGTVTSFLGIGAGAVFDWRLAAVIFGAIFFIAVCIILFMGPGNVRAWVRKQVS